MAKKKDSKVSEKRKQANRRISEIKRSIFQQGWSQPLEEQLQSAYKEREKLGRWSLGGKQISRSSGRDLASPAEIPLQVAKAKRPARVPNKSYKSNLQPSATSATDLNWEVLPLGWWREARVWSDVKSKLQNRDHSELFLERLQFIDSHSPKGVFKSRFKNRGYQYYVFLFENHVVAECPTYGNAAYVVSNSEDWRELLSRSRQELRTLVNKSVIRIPHAGEWKRKLLKYLN